MNPTPYGIVVERSPCHRIYDLGASPGDCRSYIVFFAITLAVSSHVVAIYICDFPAIRRIYTGRMPYLDCESQPSIHIGRDRPDLQKYLGFVGTVSS